MAASIGSTCFLSSRLCLNTGGTPELGNPTLTTIISVKGDSWVRYDFPTSGDVDVFFQNFLQRFCPSDKVFYKCLHHEHSLVLSNLLEQSGRSELSTGVVLEFIKDRSPLEKAIPRSQQVCVVCNKSNDIVTKNSKADYLIKKCTGCFQVAYCSTVCQTAHWPHHKTACQLSKQQ